ncbi:hypothetical protein EC973_007668 [Apophysomyces ossiformis]|uniref:Uncharacterized protein n=1 Tax=Apophysomyces ossiformis TaxID=679940 RepID=A0A8H7BF80_9FUNG|nr:hypothetical protein EC973_007668 [Apophysomyces ossiformis]
MSKVWLVTGCSSGIGEELVLEALKRGEKVAATSKSLEKLEKTFSQHKSENLLLKKIDVTDDLEIIKQSIEEIVKVFGRIDVLVNNAGYFEPNLVEFFTWKETFDLFNTNVFGFLNVTRATLPYRREQRSDIIFNISSVAGWDGNPITGLYVSSKFAVEGITSALQKEVIHLGIKVLAVQPGFTRTGFFSDNLVVNLVKHNDYEDLLDAYTSNHLLAYGVQPGDPGKIAKAIVDVARHENFASDHEIPDIIPFSNDTYNIIKDKCTKTLKLLEEWKDVIVDVDFE